MPALGGILYGAAALRHDIVVSGNQVTEGFQDSRVDINDMNFLTRPSDLHGRSTSSSTSS